MPHGPGTLTYDEKVSLIAAMPEIDVTDGWIELPRAETVGAKAIEWENQFPLDAFRRHVGLGKAVIDGIIGDDGTIDVKKSASLALSIKNRLMKVYPDESWACQVVDGKLMLRYAGKRTHRAR